ncbi:MAG: glycosyl hydrolase [Chitinivibrionales bacterium]|nr:glycosyl hydrolase [Chitinivibrionales bacterium]
MLIDKTLASADLLPSIQRMWELSAVKIRAIEATCPADTAAPVFTADGRYTSRGWTDWTRGFQYGSALLQYDATGENVFLDIGRAGTARHMAPHVTHTGVHDHGFNNVSTYGNLWRLMSEGRVEENEWERRLYELALRCSASVQASRWTVLPDGGYIYSFNGPHSLFADTIRSLRVLALGHRLGHVLYAENDRPVSLLGRLLDHAHTTARYTVYYGEGRDHYDVRGRVAHESIFNVNNGSYRCPSTQQGYSPFSTWTRGLAWVMLGFAEQLEFLRELADSELTPFGGRQSIDASLSAAAAAACDFYLESTPADGVPYWDTGAPGLVHLGDYRAKRADPFNEHEPVDSSAAAIAAQGLLRFSRWLGAQDNNARRYRQAGLTILRSLLRPPYLSEAEDHQGLLLHSIYHRPNGWDHIPEGQSVPCGESSMWGDYHLREAALLVQREAAGERYLTFYS